MSNIVFVGTVYGEGLTEELAAMGNSIDYPSHNFQLAMLEGFSSICPKMKIISALKCSTWTKTRKLYYKDRMIKVNSVYNDAIMVGALAIPVVNLFFRYKKIKKQLKSVLSKTEENIVIIYSSHSPFLQSVYDLSCDFKIKTCLIVPDLPEFMSSSKNPIFRFLKSLDAKLIENSNKAVDCYAFLSPLMRERYPYNGKPWVQVEGVYDNTVQYPDAPKSKKKSILYTGKIDARYGIVDLMDAFALIDDPCYELWIRGDGSDLDKVKKRAETDPRIKIFPKMSKEDLVKLQKSATLLVNPLKPKELFTKYFFPSKTLEYMGSGTPTLMYKLPCLADEYDEYLYYFTDDSVKYMCNRIVDICEKSTKELYELGQKAREFVNKEKNGIKQAKKILDLLSSI